jgi:enoyl-CoA hydratase
MTRPRRTRHRSEDRLVTASIAASPPKVAQNQDHQDPKPSLRWGILTPLTTTPPSDLLEGLAGHRESRVPKFTGS